MNIGRATLTVPLAGIVMVLLNVTVAVPLEQRGTLRRLVGGGEQSVELIRKKQRGKAASRAHDGACDDGGERDAIPGLERCPAAGAIESRAMKSVVGVVGLLLPQLPTKNRLNARTRPVTACALRHPCSSRQVPPHFIASGLLLTSRANRALQLLFADGEIIDIALRPDEYHCRDDAEDGLRGRRAVGCSSAATKGRPPPT